MAIFAGTKLYKGFSRASLERGLQLAEMAGFGPRGRVFVELAFERITQEEADARLAGMESEERRAP